MLRLVWLSFATLLLASFAVASSGGGTQASLGPLRNGDFETGDQQWWRTFLTSNGRMETSVGQFDTDGDGVSTFSAEFQVGQLAPEGLGVQRGGGILQEVVLGRGDLVISADIASNNPYPHCNEDGGTIQLLVDGQVQDQHGFGGVCGASAPLRDYPGPLFDHLSTHLSLSTEGKHEIRFLITRGAGLAGVSNYIDNVEFSGSAAVKPVIGTPAPTPARPVVGKRFSISFPVTRSDTGSSLTSGVMIGNPTVRGRVISHSESFVNGIARLSLVVPRTAKGKLLKVNVAITTNDGLSAARQASYRVRS